jgi:hypothetical protein
MCVNSNVYGLTDSEASAALTLSLQHGAARTARDHHTRAMTNRTVAQHQQRLGHNNSTDAQQGEATRRRSSAALLRTSQRPLCALGTGVLCAALLSVPCKYCTAQLPASI